MKTPKKKHHFVPRYYLNHFTSADEKLCVFQKSTGKIFGGAVDDYGHENRFYEIPDPKKELSPEERQTIEDLLASTEGAFDKAITKLIRGIPHQPSAIDVGLPFYILGRAEKEALATHIVIQSLRTREFRESLKQSAYLMTKATAKMVAATSPETKDKFEAYKDFIDVDIPEDYTKALQIQLLLNNAFQDRLINVCMDMVWLVGVNKSNSVLYTSDHPVSKIYHRDKGSFRGRGWFDRDLEIALPLSPNLLLNLYSRDLFEPDLSDLKARGISPNGVFELHREHVEFYNSHQIFHSFDYLYSTPNDFSQAIEMTREQAKDANPFRQRVSTHGGFGIETLPTDWKRRHKK